MDKTLERNTAIHEAGHVVALYHLGLSMIRATIVPSEEDDYWGLVIHPNYGGYEYRNKRQKAAIIRDLIVVCYAGPEAERLIAPQCDQAGWEHDEDNAWDFLREIPPRNCRHVGDVTFWSALDRLRRRARRLVLEHWSDVKRVAEALEAEKTLTGDQLWALLKEEQA